VYAAANYSQGEAMQGGQEKSQDSSKTSQVFTAGLKGIVSESASRPITERLFNHAIAFGKRFVLRDENFYHHG
jgi:hypothetical protein